MPTSNDVNILIVEDNEIDVRAIKRTFKKRKISNPVFTAQDGVEALELLRGEGGKEKLPRPYLILLDLNMPRMDGFEFLREIRNDPELAKSIVFVLTTSDDDQDKAASYAENVAGYLLKSDAGEEFLRVVGMIEQYVLTVQFPPNQA